MKALLKIWNTNRLIFAAILLTACAQDELKRVDEIGAEKEITISTIVPSLQSVQLRTTSEAEEKAVQSVDILAFHVYENGDELYDYAVKIRNMTPEHTYTAIVREKPYQQRFVIIANMGVKVQEMLASVDWKDMNKNTMLSTLEHTQLTAPFPMWGESGKIVITSLTTSLDAITMSRMVAKINVEIDKSVVGLTDKFKLKSVYLYNTNSKGNVVPHSSIEEVTIPQNVLQKGPVKYNTAADFAAPGETDIAMRGNIYLFEAAAAQATCLVVGGIYAGDTQETFYRIDFLKSDGRTRYNIFRNHQYTVNIKDVKASGHNTHEDAFVSRAVNMVADVFPWVIGLNDIVFDRQYYLSVNKSSFTFSKNHCDGKRDNNVLSIETNYAGSVESGWKIIKIDPIAPSIDASWLTITDASGRTNLDAKGTSGGKTDLVLTYTANNTGAPRTAEVGFAAGPLRYAVTVTQNLTDGAAISFYTGAIDAPDAALITNDTILIHNQSGQGQYQFTIHWTPVDADLLAYQIPLKVPVWAINVKPGLGLLTPTKPGVSDILLTWTNSTGDIGKLLGFSFIVTNGIETEQKQLIFKYTSATP